MPASVSIRTMILLIVLCPPPTSWTRGPVRVRWRTSVIFKEHRLKTLTCPGQRFQAGPMNDWMRIANEDEVPSPALLIYPDRVTENLKRMAATAGGVDRLRP